MTMMIKLSEEQEAAKKEQSKAVCVIAGAGTGKTTTVVHRLRYQSELGNIDPSKTVVITHTRIAAGELKERLVAFGLRSIQSKTIHAHSINQLKIMKQEGLINKISLQTNLRYLFTQALRDSGHQLSKDETSDVWGDIGLLRATAGKPNNLRGQLKISELETINKEFSSLKQAQGIIDFTDILELNVRKLNENPDFLEKIQQKIQHIVMDEYQDIDPLQQKLIDLWYSKNSSIFVVGDPNQAIFSFKGANPELILNFSKNYKNSKVIRLRENRRSTQKIITLSNQITRSDKKEELVSTREQGLAPSFDVYSTDKEEVAAVIERVRQELITTPASEIAILLRFNSQTANYEAGLAKEKISFTTGDENKFFEKQEILAVLKPFGILARNAPDNDGLSHLMEAAEQSGHTKEPPEGQGKSRERWDLVNSLINLCESFDELTSRELLNELLSLSKDEHSVSEKVITVSTIHSSKGKEWSTVFIPNLTKGSMPSLYAKTVKQKEEERRLLYVAITRAKNNLYMSYPKQRNGRKATVSPYLKDYFPAETFKKRTETKNKFRSLERPNSKITGCKKCGGRLKGMPYRKLRYCQDCASTAFEKKLEPIEAWRTELGQRTSQKPDELLTEKAMLNLMTLNPTSTVQIKRTLGVAKTIEDKELEKLLNILLTSS